MSTGGKLFIFNAVRAAYSFLGGEGGWGEGVWGTYWLFPGRAGIPPPYSLAIGSTQKLAIAIAKASYDSPEACVRKFPGHPEEGLAGPPPGSDLGDASRGRLATQGPRRST